MEVGGNVYGVSVCFMEGRVPTTEARTLVSCCNEHRKRVTGYDVSVEVGKYSNLNKVVEGDVGCGEVFSKIQFVFNKRFLSMWFIPIYNSIPTSKGFTW